MPSAVLFNRLSDFRHSYADRTVLMWSIWYVIAMAGFTHVYNIIFLLYIDKFIKLYEITFFLNTSYSWEKIKYKYSILKFKIIVGTVEMFYKKIHNTLYTN